MRSGPREELQLQGAEALPDDALLAVLLGTGRRGETAQVAAGRLLRTLGGVAALAQTSFAMLAKQPAVGPAKAARVLAAIELGRRCHAAGPVRGQRIDSSRAVHELLGPRLRHTLEERFLCLALDAKNNLIAFREIARGGRHRCAVEPCLAFRPAVLEAASGVIFVHNHPSGDSQPSQADRELTTQLAMAGRILGIPLLDHVVVGHRDYFSFCDQGLLRSDAQ